jgi:hypothetical protein
MKNRKNSDLPDSKVDKEKLQREETTLDLPEVTDIPGQENIHPPRFGEYADTTISSDGEEGIGLLDDLNELQGEDGDLSLDEKAMLNDAGEELGTNDQQEPELDRARLDRRDEDGDLLNERINTSGSDLDVPGTELDDADEEIGEEDEENNSYSLGGDKD